MWFLRVAGKALLWALTFVLEPLFFRSRDKWLIVFGSEGGHGFSGNSKALFAYLIENSRFRCIWLTRDIDVLKKISTDYGPSRVYGFYSVRGIASVLRSRTVVVSHGTADLPLVYFHNGRTNIIQTWHGSPFKKMGFLDKRYEKEPGRISSVSRKDRRHLTMLKRDSRLYRALLTSSEFTRDAFASCFSLDPHKIRVTGQPRSDRLLDGNVENNERLLRLRSKHDVRSVILYAPTYRDDGAEARFFPFADFAPDSLGEFLEESRSLLLLRGHINEDVSYELTNLSDRIALFDRSACLDIYDVLSNVDILITDYSSICLDFLLLDRPVIYVPYDLEQYEKERGLLYEYDSVTPGPKVHTQRDLLHWIEKFLKEPALYGVERTRVSTLFNSYRDGKSCQRVRELIESML